MKALTPKTVHSVKIRFLAREVNSVAFMTAFNNLIQAYKNLQIDYYNGHLDWAGNRNQVYILPSAEEAQRFRTHVNSWYTKRMIMISKRKKK